MNLKTIFIGTLIATVQIFSDLVSSTGNIIETPLSVHSNQPMKVNGKKMVNDADMVKVSKSTI